ncbi:MAG: S-methyl-5-thioribose kinase [Ruminococcaceae bacterium]|nr:S-methyl-5-thioribose kinase [Oscillospiraceae bacterium]
MKDFSEFFLMNTQDVMRYAVEVLGFFEKDEELICSEIGDGNINYVFKVQSQNRDKSVIVKQADRFLRSSGRPLDTYRNKIEAHILMIEGELAPGFVPIVYHYDETMAACSMEDVSAFLNLRHELAENRIYPHLADNLSTFMAKTLLPTTDLVLDRAEKKRRVGFFVNPELCEISEDLVLTEPYYNFKNRNIISPGNEDFVNEQLYEDEALHAEIAYLRERFMNLSQALIHGDLHSGSVFANEEGIKVLDPEFAFYGPMGYDIGNVVGNLLFSLVNKNITMPQNTTAIKKLEDTIADVWDLTFSKLSSMYDELVSFKLYKTEGFKKQYFDSVMADSLGYAGTEIIRRTVGDSKVSEVNSVTEGDLRIRLERVLTLIGKELIMRRRESFIGRDIVCIANRIIKETA